MNNPTLTINGKQKDKYLFVFLLAFGIMMFIMLPSIIYNNGIFLYYGDFNSQQLPFYQHAHEAVRNGNFFWDWGTDLGANFIGSYSFYLLGSPFFWLTVPFPSSAVLYFIPWLLALKVGVAALTSYAFIKRFVKSKNACVIGALLYAFSGFQAYNVFFNHFHDVVAFFPLLLIALEERVQNNRRGVFALTVALSAIVNYFFFTGQVTFLIIYFFCRMTSKDFNITFKKFLALAVEAVLGVMLACFMLVPAVLAISSNPRVAGQLLGHDMVIYGDKFRIIRIIQSFFMIPDPPARSNLFSSSNARWASIAGYLPMFSMAGVIAFLKGKGKHWASKIVAICIIFAFVPFLNTAFYGFNSSYYARWYYMPILIMAMMTAYVLDNKKMSIKTGLPLCGAVLGFFVIVGILPVKENGKIVFGSLPEYKMFFWVSTMITVALFAVMSFLILYIKRDKLFLKKSVIFTAVAVLICTGCVVWYGMAQGPYQDAYIRQAINGGDKITLDADVFFRTDISESCDNYPIFWGYSSMRTFHSIVPSSIMTFYEKLGITRDVASRAETNRFALRGLLSVKYYFNKVGEEKITMPGFEYLKTENEFEIYENKYFVPMGFTYDFYIDDEQFNSKFGTTMDKLLMKALLLDDEQILRHSDILDKLSTDIENDNFSNEDYQNDCLKRQANSAYYFETDTNGFSAKINLKKESLVFFSVPYDKGFSALVNGEKALIEKVDNGFMAVRCPKGEGVEIIFNYETGGLKMGIMISLFGLILLIAFVFVGKKLSPNAPKKEIMYDYDEACEDEFDEADEPVETSKTVDITDEIATELPNPKDLALDLENETDA